MKPPDDPHAEHIARTLQQAGHKACYAGGAVRDMLLGRACKDIDIATDAPPDTVQRLFPRTTDVLGKCFGVIRVLEADTYYEVAAFREDGSYADGRRPDSVVFSTPEKDAQRRDFTINGLFYDPVAGEIIDFVKGQEDLKGGLIRAIGNPHERFSEDRLRLFRAVRFAAELGFEIESATWAAVKELADTSRSLAPERVREELAKMFTGSHPRRALELLSEAGLLPIWLPEVEEQKGVEQPPQFHPEGDVWAHVTLMMDELREPSEILAFSVLLHDIGKKATRFVDDQGRARFNGHEHVGADMAREILQRLRFSNEKIDAISTCVANHMAFKDAMNMRVSKLKKMLARPTFLEELELHRIDCKCSHGDQEIHDFLKQKLEEFSTEEIRPKPFITGRDLLDMGMPSGPDMGKLLDTLEEEQLENSLTSREQALERARELVLATQGHVS